MGFAQQRTLIFNIKGDHNDYGDNVHKHVTIMVTASQLRVVVG